MNCRFNAKVMSNDKQQKVSRKITENETFSSTVKKHSNAKTNSNTSSPTKKIPVVQPKSSQEKVKTLDITKSSELHCQITNQIRITNQNNREINDKIETDQVRFLEESFIKLLNQSEKCIFTNRRIKKLLEMNNTQK